MRSFENKRFSISKNNIDKISLLIVTILLLGIVFGSFYYSFYVKNTEFLWGKNALEALLFKSGFLKNFLLRSFCFIIIAFLSTSIVGYPFILITLFFFSFEKGMIITFFISHYGLQGLLIDLLCFIPQYLTCYIIIFLLSKLAFNYSFSLHNLFSQGKRTKTYDFKIKDLVIRVVILYGIYFISIVWEYFISPIIFKLFI